MVRLASGSCTFSSCCQIVEPNDSPTSFITTGTLRRPCAVSRTAGGTAYTTVAATAGGYWMPNSSTSTPRYTNTGITCAVSRKPRRKRSALAERAVQMPSGMPMVSEMPMPTSISDSVIIVRSQ